MTSTIRKVSKNLGINLTSRHEQIYNMIESTIGPTKKCNFGHKCGSKTGVKHEGDENVPIRNFNTKSCQINEIGEIIIQNGDGLQTQCKTCDTERRHKRLEMAREKNKGDGYAIYEKEYGTISRICSQCKIYKNVRECFRLSSGMECGIHNKCYDCEQKYGESVGDRLMKYRPDGTFQYKKTETNQHDDHIMPLAFGGTNEEINHQLISSKENLVKSSSLPFENVMEINPLLLCSRWRHILYEAQREKIDIVILKSRLSNAILNEQKLIYCMNNSDIEQIYQDYNKNNNKRHDTKRCVEKFKTYCKEILKL